MAKRIKRVDLENLLISSLKTALKSEIAGCTISSNSISATIRVVNDSIAGSILEDDGDSQNLPFHIFKELLEIHTGKDNLIPTIVKEDKAIIIRVNYEIMD